MAIQAHEIHHEARSCQATACGHTSNHPGVPAFLASIMTDFNSHAKAPLAVGTANRTDNFAQNVAAAAGQFVQDLGKLVR